MYKGSHTATFLLRLGLVHLFNCSHSGKFVLFFVSLIYIFWITKEIEMILATCWSHLPICLLGCLPNPLFYKILYVLHISTCVACNFSYSVVFLFTLLIVLLDKSMFLILMSSLSIFLFTIVAFCVFLKKSLIIQN